MSDLQARVRELRRKLDLSQSDFAERLGVTMMTVHRWEHGKAKPTPMACILIEKMEDTIDCCPLCFRKYAK